jgi:hypothetical protein
MGTTIIVFSCHFSCSIRGEDDPAPIVPDQDAQSRIERGIERFRDFDRSLSERWAAIGALNSLAEEHDVFLQQLFYFYIQHARRQTIDADAKKATAIWFLRLFDISDVAITRAVMPFLDSQDEVMRSAARHFLEVAAAPSGFGEESSFSTFTYVLSPEPQGSELSLVSYMYEVSPSSAFLALVENSQPVGDEQRDLLWAEHVISDAVWKQKHGFDEALGQAKPMAFDQLQALSHNDQWWVRLYVAEVLRRYPDLGTPEMIDRLKTDEHDLVRQVFLESGGKAEADQRPARQNDTQKLQPGGG